MATIIESLKTRVISPLRVIITRHMRNFTKTTTMQDVFERIYRTNHWKGEASHSGTGSDLIQTETIRQSLPSLIAELNVKKMLDIPAGTGTG